ncbi:Protein CBG10180 [Caenorhabditis briggsae]|uniref:Protein CBG10180 n=1 Tax=Caenorhabditis briggsae TaxID=6238 RepID=A8XAW1_CAEBR|nr:Protein CBG10180 [Caenorhabditis briggsae]CAP29776.1 Protein CBG10180 [Caenorhabditis briggsae]
MDDQEVPLQSLPDDVSSEVLKTMNLQEIISYSFRSKHAHAMVVALGLPIVFVQIRIEESPAILMHVEGSTIKFTLEMSRNNEMITNLDDVPVSVRVLEGNEERDYEPIMSNRKMNLGEWMQHFRSFSMDFQVDFYVGKIKFDIQSLRNTLPNLRCIGINCLKHEPDESDILNTQNLLRAFLPDVQHLKLHRFPLHLSLQHIGIANLKILEIYFPSDLSKRTNFVDISTWNVESCVIMTMDDKMSIIDLNRFFQIVDKGIQSKVEGFVHLFAPGDHPKL